MLKAQTGTQNKWKDLLLSGKHKGLAGKYFIAGPPCLPGSPLCPGLSSQGWRAGGQTPALAPTVPWSHCSQEWDAGFQRQLGAGGDHFQKGFGAVLAPVPCRAVCVPRLCLQSTALPWALLSPSPAGSWASSSANLPGRASQHPRATPKCPLDSKHRNTELLGQTWGEMSQTKRKMPVVDKRNDSWKWCFQGSFILGTGKMQ